MAYLLNNSYLCVRSRILRSIFNFSPGEIRQAFKPLSKEYGLSQLQMFILQNIFSVVIVFHCYKGYQSNHISTTSAPCYKLNQASHLFVPYTEAQIKFVI
jgi:hypothetical protein